MAQQETFLVSFVKQKELLENISGTMGFLLQRGEKLEDLFCLVTQGFQIKMLGIKAPMTRKKCQEWKARQTREALRGDRTKEKGKKFMLGTEMRPQQSLTSHLFPHFTIFIFPLPDQSPCPKPQNTRQALSLN